MAKIPTIFGIYGDKYMLVLNIGYALISLNVIVMVIANYQ